MKNGTYFWGIKLDCSKGRVILRDFIEKIVPYLGWCHIMTPEGAIPRFLSTWYSSSQQGKLSWRLVTADELNFSS